MTQNEFGLDPEDLFVWSDGTFCFREDVAEYSYMSDDYEVLAFGSPQYNSFQFAMDAGCPSLEHYSYGRPSQQAHA